MRSLRVHQCATESTGEVGIEDVDSRQKTQIASVRCGYGASRNWIAIIYACTIAILHACSIVHACHDLGKSEGMRFLYMSISIMCFAFRLVHNMNSRMLIK